MVLINTINQEPLYIGPANKKHIYICLSKTHYNVIKSMKQFTIIIATIAKKATMKSENINVQHNAILVFG